MKKWFLLLLLLNYQRGNGQNIPVSNEDFINAVSKLVVDSNSASYYLFANAASCSFKKYDYDDWYKYGLKEDVPIYILDELAKKSYLNASPYTWHQDKLLHAFCIDEATAKMILSAAENHPVKHNHSGSSIHQPVYYFSRPSFTDDYQYAVIDMGFRCDDKQCGIGATFLFKQVNGRWTVAGKKEVWGN